MYVYNISGGVATIFCQSCAQIDNNQQTYEAQIQVPRCNSIKGKGVVIPF
jgi:NAD-dependent SIR2 family protein deacetylase